MANGTCKLGLSRTLLSKTLKDGTIFVSFTTRKDGLVRVYTYATWTHHVTDFNGETRESARQGFARLLSEGFSVHVESASPYLWHGAKCEAVAS